MLVDIWMLGGALLFLALTFAVSYLGQMLATRFVEKRLYSLECDVADLQNKVLSEIKKRAANLAVKAKAEDQLFEQLAQNPPKPAEPWWMKYAGGGSSQ